MAFSWWSWQGKQPTPDQAQEYERLRKNAPIPTIWLFGKTGSGKSSAIQFLTGADAATVGQGYRPETKTSRRFDFPDAEDPLLTFLDTRGLGEASYDPAEDIHSFSESTQLMIVTVRVTDHALSSVLDPLRTIRSANPNRPVVLALTCLHEAVGGDDLSAEGKTVKDLPPQLCELIEEKKRQFHGLFDTFLPMDLTQPEDGFADPDFGGDELQRSILDKMPHAYRQALLALQENDRSGKSTRQQKSRWHVLGSSALAATAGAVPLPWIDIPAVLAIQAHLAVQIAKIYDQELTPARWAILSSAAGSRVMIRLAIRSTLKLIPVIGMAAGAASSFAFTYALGMSWDWYFANLRDGNVPKPETLRDVFSNQLKRGHELWRTE